MGRATRQVPLPCQSQSPLAPIAWRSLGTLGATQVEPALGMTAAPALPPPSTQLRARRLRLPRLRFHPAPLAWRATGTLGATQVEPALGMTAAPALPPPSTQLRARLPRLRFHPAPLARATGTLGAAILLPAPAGLAPALIISPLPRIVPQCPVSPRAPPAQVGTAILGATRTSSAMQLARALMTAHLPMARASLP